MRGLLAAAGVIVALQTAILSYVVSIEHRMTKLETIVAFRVRT